MMIAMTPSKPRALVLASLLLGGLALACGQPPAATAPAETAPAAEPATAATPAPAAAGLEVRDAQISLTPGMGAVYLTVVNPGGEPDRLVSVTTDGARAAETHETVEEEGIMKMVPHPDGFAVPAAGTLELQPGGKHLMLVDPQIPANGEPFRLTLHFEHAGPVEVEVPVGMAGMEPEDMEHEGMEHEGMEHEGMEHGEMGHEGTDPH